MPKYYVSTEDTFLSGWGKAKNKTNVLIFECNNKEEAGIVAANAKNRTDQRCIEIHKTYPHFLPASAYYVQHKDKNEYPAWYVKDYFKKQKESA